VKTGASLNLNSEGPGNWLGLGPAIGSTGAGCFESSLPKQMFDASPRLALSECYHGLSTRNRG